MAEALAIVGLVSSIAQFVDLGSKIVERLQDFHSSLNTVPKTFQDVKVVLPLLLDTLKRTQAQAESGAYSKETQEALFPVVEGCRAQVELLDNILVKILPKPEDSSLRRSMLAFSSVSQERKVEQIASTLRNYVQILTYNQSTGATASALPPGPVAYEVRPLRLVGAPIVSDFVERPQVIEMIEKEMLPISTERQTIVVLHGIGGTGKSQIAKRYAELHQSDYSAAFWINATTEYSTKLSIAKLAELIPLPNVLNSTKEIPGDEDGIADARRAVNEWLCSKGNGKWLLIFDDVPWTKEGDSGHGDPSENHSIAEEAFEAYEYVPMVSHGSILVTSRVSSVVYAFGAGSVHIDAMLEDESVQLLCKACRRSTEKAEMRTLAARLGMHPLALSQAGRYLLETRLSVSSYLEKYDARFKMLLKRQPLAREYRNGSVDATLSLSFDSLAARDPSAAALLMLWSCFDKSNILFGLFGCLSQLGASGSIMSISPDSLNPRTRIAGLPPTWLDQICANEENWLAHISALQNFSFIRQNDREDSISLHPLIHEWSIPYCELSWAKDNMAAAANIIGAAIMATKESRVGAVYSSLQSHVDYWYSMLPLRSSQSFSQTGVDTAAIFEIAHFYRRRGFTDRYTVLSNDLLDTFIARLGPTHRKALELRLDILSVLLEESKWEDAIQGVLSLREQILQIRWMPSLTLKENNAFVLSSLAWHLSVACCEVGKMEPLKELLSEIEKLQDDPDILRVRPSLEFACLWLKYRIASFQSFQGKDGEITVYNPYPLMEAEIKYLEILDDTTLWPTPPARQHQLTQSHLLRLLGEQYFDQRDLVKAKACLVKSLEIFKGIDGLQGHTTLGLAGAIVSHGWAPNSPPVLGIPNWHKSITSVLRMVVKEMEEVQGSPSQSGDYHSSQKHGSTALGHLQWSKAISSVRTIVQERPAER